MEKEEMLYLQKKLDAHRKRALIRFKTYDQKTRDNTPSITTSSDLKQIFNAVSGWSTSAVDKLADRLIFREFKNDDFNFEEIFGANNPDIFFDSAILSALISSCSFVYIRQVDGERIPTLEVIEGTNATGIIDPTTGLLKEGYAVLERDAEKKPTLEAFFEPGLTTFYKNGEKEKSIKNTAPAPLLVPIIHRPDPVRPFGRSRITRAAESYQKLAQRTLERSDVTAEFYSFPQKYATGIDPDVKIDKWKATISTFLTFSKDSEGESPKIGQFTTSSMAPFLDQVRLAASLFAGETGLTMDELGFVSDNPSSAESIKAAHENLRLAARKAQRCFGSGFVNVGYLAACIRDGMVFKRSAFHRVKPTWYPIFEADASTMNLIGDGAIKMNQAIPGYLDKDKINELTGMD